MANKTTYKIDVKQKGAEKAKSSLTSLAKSAAGLAAAYMSVSKGMEFMTESVELFKVQDLAVRRVEAALKSTKGVAGVTSTELQKLASSLQGVSTFGDEATLEMTALLLTFTNIKGAVLKDSIKMVQNMASAMGTDMKTQALMLGKALNDPVKGVAALSRVGVALTDVQIEQIKAFDAVGDSAAAQNVILKELATQFGGMAAAEAKSFTGAMTQMWNAIGDVQEVIGSKLAPTMQHYAEIVLDYLSVPVVDQLQSEQAEYNNLLTTLLRLKPESEGRVRIITELKEKYPAYLGDLDLEKASYEDIVKLQAESSEVMKSRIIIQMRQDEITAAQERAEEIARELVQAEKDLTTAEEERQKASDKGATKYFGFGGVVADDVDMANESYDRQVELVNQLSIKYAEANQSLQTLMTTESEQQIQANRIIEENEVRQEEIAIAEKKRNFDRLSNKEKFHFRIEQIEAKAAKMTQKYEESNVSTYVSAAGSINESLKGGAKNRLYIRLAESIANVYAGATAAIAEGGWPKGFVEAAVIIANGLAQVDQIKQEFETIKSAKTSVKAQYGFEGVVTDPTTFTVGEGGAAEYVSVTPMEGANNAGGGLVVNITGNVMSQDFVEGELAEKVQEAVRKGVSFV